MKFTALSEKEIFEKNLLKAGVYPFEIEDAFEETSMAGNEMIRLQVRIMANGQSKVMNDYLVAKGKGMVKPRQASVVCGLLTKYDAGVVTADDCPGHKGRLKLGVERDRSGRFPPKNVIAEYLS